MSNVKKYLNNFFRYKGLLTELVSRDLKVKYRRSFLGYIWSILNPLLMMIVIATVFSYMFRFDIDNYPVYLLIGQLVYSFFSEATNMSMNSIIQGGNLIKKVYLPKYIFPLSRTLSCFVNFLFSLAALVLILVLTKTPITPVIFLFPVTLLYALLFSIGVGLILSVLAVFFRDVVHLYGVFLTALMYLTPIFYPLSALPENVAQLIMLNPLYHIITMFRDIVMYGTFPSLEQHLICLAWGLGSILVGLIIFKKKQDNFVMYL